MNRRVATLAALSLAMPALAACGGSDPGGGEKDFATDGAFTATINSDPGDLNPLVTNLVNAQIVGMYSYDSLIFFDFETGEAAPFLAKTWTESPTKVTYTLREGITCADGTPFTAQTAADNLNWIADPDNQSPRLESVVPADAKASAKGNVLTVTTTKPRPFMLYDIGGQQLVCDGGLEDPKSLSDGSHGTGPFVIDRVVAGDSITLTRRDGYTWGPKESAPDTPGMPKTVTIKIVPSPSTTANQLLSGELNAATVSGQDEDRLTGLESQPSPPSISGMIIYNHLEGAPTADVDVRRALTQAIDLDTLTEILTGGKGNRATSLLSDGPLCTYDSVEGTLPSYDPEAAADALQAAGSPTITLVYDNSTDTRSAAAEYVAQQWEDAGAEVKLDGGDENFVISQTFATDDPSGWTATLGLNLQAGTPAIFPQYLSGPAAPGSTNFASIDNADYDSAVEAASTLSGDAGCAKWAEAEKALMTEADLIPVSVTSYKMYFSGATALYPPVGGGLLPSAIRVLK